MSSIEIMRSIDIILHQMRQQEMKNEARFRALYSALLVSNGYRHGEALKNTQTVIDIINVNYTI